MRLDREETITAGAGARGWWRRLQPDPESGRPGDRGALARLRRAATPLEAAGVPETVLLLRALRLGPAEFEDVAVCAAVLAHVREDTPGLRVAARIGIDPANPESRPLLAPLRFRRLIEVRDAQERLTQFRRLAALAGGRLDVGDLAVALLDWSDLRRRNWIFRYHGGEPPTRPTNSPLTGDAA